MKPTYLRFLRNLCVVNNQAMGSMQDLVCGLLKEYEGDLFIKCFVSDVDDEGDGFEMGESFDKDILVFRHGNAKRKIPGEELLQDGTKPLRLSWNAKWAKGGVNTMLLRQLVMMAGAKRRQTDPSNIYTDVYDYLLEQLRLFNALCLGRNYLGIIYVEEYLHLTYEILLQGVMNKRLPWDIREEFCRLMTSLHIDREPYILVTYPNLTRLADEQIDETNNRSGSNQFVLLQCFVLQHLRDFDKLKDIHKNQSAFNQMGFMRFMAALIDAVLTLVQLDFFSRPNMVREFAGPLIKCLDGAGDINMTGRGKLSIAKKPSRRLARRNPLSGSTKRNKKKNHKVFPEQPIDTQSSLKQTNSEADEGDNETRGCCEELTKKKLDFKGRVRVFINATVYMIILTAFVFLSTFVGYVSFTFVGSFNASTNIFVFKFLSAHA